MLNEDGTLDGSLREAKLLLRVGKDVSPELSFFGRLELGKVEVRPGSIVDKFLSIVVDEESEVKQGSRHGLVVDEHMLLRKMPTTGANLQDGVILPQRVLLLCGGMSVGDVSTDGIIEIDLPFDLVSPGRRVGVFKVCHEDLGARIECVDDHLPLGGSCDLNSSVLQIPWDGSTLPALVFPNIFRVRVEVREPGAVINV